MGLSAWVYAGGTISTTTKRFRCYRFNYKQIIHTHKHIGVIINILEIAWSVFFFIYFVVVSFSPSHSFLCSCSSTEHSKSLECLFMLWAQLEHSILTFIWFGFSTFWTQRDTHWHRYYMHSAQSTHTQHLFIVSVWTVWILFATFSFLFIPALFLCVANSDISCKLVIRHENLSPKFVFYSYMK